MRTCLRRWHVQWKGASDLIGKTTTGSRKRSTVGVFLDQRHLTLRCVSWTWILACDQHHHRSPTSTSLLHIFKRPNAPKTRGQGIVRRTSASQPAKTQPPIPFVPEIKTPAAVRGRTLSRSRGTRPTAPHPDPNPGTRPRRRLRRRPLSFPSPSSPSSSSHPPHHYR